MEDANVISVTCHQLIDVVGNRRQITWNKTTVVIWAKKCVQSLPVSGNGKTPPGAAGV